MGSNSSYTACVQACGVGCPAPQYWVCGANGERYCNTCVLACAGTTEVTCPSADEVLCTSTGGTVAAGMCCGSASDFPDECNVGACGCGPSSGVAIKRCTCPATQCFLPGTGCH